MRLWRLRPALGSLRSRRQHVVARISLAPTGTTYPPLPSPSDLFFAFTPTGATQQAPLDPAPDRSSNAQPDERTLKLGQTLRILQARLPTLLASPLPQEVLSPHISLHLFPSTHPHLPTVSGRVAYHAALWTSPITWGKIPLVGNVNLEILSERMVRMQPQHVSVHADGLEYGSRRRAGRNSSGNSIGNEKLIVRWRTCGKTKGLGTGAGYKGIGARQSVDKITAWLGGDEKRDDAEFCGKFIFEFDEEGRILDHVIERAEEGWDPSQWENGLGRVVALTDWLLGRLGGRTETEPSIAMGVTNDQARSLPGDRR